MKTRDGFGRKRKGSQGGLVLIQDGGGVDPPHDWGGNDGAAGQLDRDFIHGLLEASSGGDGVHESSACGREGHVDVDLGFADDGHLGRCVRGLAHHEQGLVGLTFEGDVFVDVADFRQQLFPKSTSSQECQPRRKWSRKLLLLGCGVG